MVIILHFCFQSHMEGQWHFMSCVSLCFGPLFQYFSGPWDVCDVTFVIFISKKKSCMICAFFISWQVGILYLDAEFREDKLETLNVKRCSKPCQTLVLYRRMHAFHIFFSYINIRLGSIKNKTCFCFCFVALKFDK